MKLNMMVYSSTLAVVVLALLLAFRNFFNIKKPKTHKTKEEDDMYNLAKTIREGAKTFLDTEYGTITVVVALVALGFTLFFESTSGLTFILGACMSSAAVYIGMYGAAYANYRVARRAFKSYKSLGAEKAIGRTVWTALKGGSIAGLSVQALGMFGITVIYILQYVIFKDHPTGHGLMMNLTCDANMMRCTTYALGCSTVAMFNRVAGGNFTKSADISADKMNKLDLGFDEDDPRIPNVLLDFIGDLVNDIAGNCSDLLESFVATLVASQLISNTVNNKYGEAYNDLYNFTCLFPIVVATIGLFGCIIGIGIAMLRKENMSDNPAGELNKVTYVSAAISLVGSLVASYCMFGNVMLYDDFKAGWASPWWATFFGIVSGVLIGKSTEWYTSTEFKFIKKLAESAIDGTADLLTRGTALGFRSCLIPIVLVAGSIYVSNRICGLYGIAMASVGMLSFVGATVSIDAFGPIADNAGGIAEACHLDPKIRQKVTDPLDACGNTTAAIGKGSAIGSAAYATTALNISYIGIFSLGGALVLNIADPSTLSGAFVGTGLLAYFSFMLLENLMDSTHVLTVKGRELIDENKEEILAGRALPRYNALVKIGVKQSNRKMAAPSLLGMLSPIPCIFILGYMFVGGMQIGVILLGVVLAIYTSNTGGAFDNSKKYVEEGRLPGEKKGGKAHRNTVIGDTYGDGLKDVWAVCIDIFSKSLSTSACTIAPIAVAIQQNGTPSIAEMFAPTIAFAEQIMSFATQAASFVGQAASFVMSHVTPVLANISPLVFIMHLF